MPSPIEEDQISRRVIFYDLGSWAALTAKERPLQKVISTIEEDEIMEGFIFLGSRK